MTVGLIGFGRFGRLVARFLAPRVKVLVHDARSIHPGPASKNVEIKSLRTVAAQKLVVLAVPISVLESTLLEIRPFVTPGALILDVCSVKVWPIRWMRRILPSSVHILGTHPLFGPESVTRSLRGRKIVLCPVRISKALLTRVSQELRQVGLEASSMSPAQHDRMIAETLLLTQYVGRLVHLTGVQKWAGSTLHYGKLMDLVRVAERDSAELFRDLWRFNPYAPAMARKLDFARNRIERELSLPGVSKKA